MKEKLEALGWVKYYECASCGHKQYFNHPGYPGYEIRTRPRNNTFSIILKNVIVGGPFWGYEIEKKISEYVKL